MSLGGRIGEIQWHRIIEDEGPEFDVGFLIPDATADALAPHRAWLEPRFLDPATDKLVLVTQSYVLRTRHHVILIDSCVGNDKERRFHRPWSHRTGTRYLDALAAAGLAPDDVDFVMCTHLHADHVGWNTRLIDGRWVPTFPNAKYIFSRREYDYWEAENDRGADPPGPVWRDSCRPVVEAGQALLVDDDWELEDSIWLTPTPGHSPGHVCVNVRSQGQRAVFTGDLMHHALQCIEPDWSTCFCADPAMAARARRGVLEGVADTDTIGVPTHCPGPTAGRVVGHAESWRFQFLDG